MSIKKFFIASILFSPLIILLPYINEFPYPYNSQFSDFTITHYPNMIYLQRVITTEGVLPLWSNTIMSGYPFFADPLAGLWYPFLWMFVFIPQPAGLNLMILGHLFLGGIGMYKFLRLNGHQIFSALVGGVVFEAMPKVFAHYGSGHITLICSVALTSWLLYFEKKSSIGLYKKRLWVMPGVVYGLIILADIRWAAYSGILWIAYKITCFYKMRNRKNGILWNEIFNLIKQVCTSLFIAAPLLLPFIQFTNLSTRTMMSPGDRSQLALPITYLLGLIIPNFSGYAEWVIYPGIGVLISIILAFGNFHNRFDRKFWIGVLIISIILSLGSVVPGFDFIMSLPLLSLLRVPSRFLFLTGISFSVLLANGLDVILNAPDRGISKNISRFFLACFALNLFVFCLSFIMLYFNTSIEINFIWADIWVIIFSAIFVVFLKGWLSRKGFQIIFIPLVLFDLLFVNYFSINFKPEDEVLNYKKDVVQYLKADPSIYRTYSPSYSLPQEISARNNIELADGINPLQLITYTDYMTGASGVPQSGYSVTIPSFSNGSPATDNIRSVPVGKELALLNVKYIISDFPITSLDIEFQKYAAGKYIYLNKLELPRAWIQNEQQTVGSDIQSVANIEIHSNKIVLSTNEKGLLVLSELYYPGWTVSVDGIPGTVEKVGGLFRGVVLPIGSHQVVFEFNPLILYIGLIMAGISWIITGFVLIKKDK